jgi:hypothetical protein
MRDVSSGCSEFDAFWVCNDCPSIEEKAVFGLWARGEFMGGDALKWVDGLVSGKTCKDGGGTPEGKLWFAEAKDAKGLAMLSEDSN